jgi:hypothetical protein
LVLSQRGAELVPRVGGAGEGGSSPDKAKTRWRRLILAGRFDDELVHLDVGDTVRQIRPLRAATSPAPACDHSVLLVRQARSPPGRGVGTLDPGTGARQPRLLFVNGGTPPGPRGD